MRTKSSRMLQCTLYEHNYVIGVMSFIGFDLQLIVHVILG